jgi:hypothetical protein
MRARTTFAALLIALIGCGAIASSADAAYYAMSREIDAPRQQFLRFGITVQHGYIERLEARLPKGCEGSGRGPHDLDFDDLHIRIQSDGRFRRNRGETSSRWGTAFFGLEGRVVGRRLTARFGQWTKEESYPEYFSCWTGRSYDDPWVRFVAHRQPRP